MENPVNDDYERLYDLAQRLLFFLDHPVGDLIGWHFPHTGGDFHLVYNSLCVEVGWDEQVAARLSAEYDPPEENDDDDDNET